MSPGSGSLLQAAWRLLSRGPASPARVAREVLGMKGHGGAAAATVLALLGADERFRLDSAGRWSVRPGDGPPGKPLSRLDYAVVDVETTGGTHEQGHRMTELAVVHVSEGRVGDVFSTLLHPGRRVHPAAARLTGITDAMLVRAPSFEDVADRIARRLEGRVFVAHNVGFDWGWVRAQLGEALADVPQVPRLCTISLARRLVPELRRRSLDALADHFDVPIDARHRAYGDALATARILIRLLDRAESLGIGDLHSLRRYRPSRAARDQGDLFAGLRPSPSGARAVAGAGRTRPRRRSPRLVRSPGPRDSAVH